MLKALARHLWNDRNRWRDLLNLFGNGQMPIHGASFVYWIECRTRPHCPQE
jgi:hypothetical protein